MKKALIVSTVSRQFTLFERGNIEVLKELGYEIHGAANYKDATPELEELGIQQHHIDIQRSPFKLDNLKAYKQLVKLMREEEFDLVHCHAPMGGVIGRLAAKNVGIKNVLYTAHGFHFFKGAPKVNWLVYYPIEKFLSRYTNTLITINKEDYNLAVNNKFRAKNIELVNGIGLNLEKFSPVTEEEKYRLREEYGYSKRDKILIYVGELNEGKNQALLIQATKELSKDIKDIRLLLVGEGKLKEEYNSLIKAEGLESKVKLLGYRKDVCELLSISDIYISASRREGLPVNIMEAMAIGLPIICSKIRGQEDLVDDMLGGRLYEMDNKVEMINKIKAMLEEDTENKKKSIYNRKKIIAYGNFEIKKRMRKIYMDQMQK